MNKKKANFWGVYSFKDPKVIAVLAIFSALSIVCGKYLAFNMGDTIRFSFENLPIILSGIFFGPIAGAVVGLVADLVGCLLVGYAINPIITLAAVLMGFLSGLIWRFSLRLPDIIKVFLTAFSCHAVCSVLIKTIGFLVYYKSPFWATLGLRSVNYLVVATAEVLIIYLLVRNKGLMKQIKKVSER